MVAELGPLLPFSNITVTYINDCFTVELDDTDSIPLSANDISDAKFPVWNILQRSLGPIWLSSPNEQLSQSLSTVNLPALTSSIANQSAVRFGQL